MEVVLPMSQIDIQCLNDLAYATTACSTCNYPYLLLELLEYLWGNSVFDYLFGSNPATYFHGFTKLCSDLLLAYATMPYESVFSILPVAKLISSFFPPIQLDNVLSVFRHLQLIY